MEEVSRIVCEVSGFINKTTYVANKDNYIKHRCRKASLRQFSFAVEPNIMFLLLYLSKRIFIEQRIFAKSIGNKSVTY